MIIQIRWDMLRAILIQPNVKFGGADPRGDWAVGIKAGISSNKMLWQMDDHQLLYLAKCYLQESVSSRRRH